MAMFAKKNSVTRWLGIARALLEQPTAPCREQHQQAHVRQFVQARPALALTEDPSGNLLVRCRAAASRRTPLVIVAHMDHPGFWIERVTAERVKLRFKGFVGAGCAHRGNRVQFFDLNSPRATGSGWLKRVVEKDGLLHSAIARIAAGHAAPGGFAMWDFPAFSIRRGRIVARGCDDMMGCATALCALDELARRRPRDGAFAVLFTRAEEIGFLGAMEALRHHDLPRNACVISLETSKAAGIAPQGEGIAIRVGDRSSIFDPAVTAGLVHAAEALRKQNRNFHYQRKLMDGGTCEATVFCFTGFRAGGLALPLGNYHNQAVTRRGKSIGPETIAIRDFACGVQLLVALAARPKLLTAPPKGLPKWLKERAAIARRQLAGRRQPRRAKTPRTFVR
jgi:endoglucanase